MDLVSDNQPHRKIDLLFASERILHLVVGLLRVAKFKVEKVVQQRDSEADVNFGEGLAQTHAFASHKRRKSKWVSLASVRCQIPLVAMSFRVKALGHKLPGLQPDLGVVVDSVIVNHNLCVSLEMHCATAKRNVTLFNHSLSGGSSNWRLNSQGLVVAHHKVVKLHNLIVTQILQALQGSQWRSDLRQQFLADFGMLR